MAFDINDTSPRDQYVAFAAQTVFTISFEFLNDEDIKAYLTPVGNDPDDNADILTLSTDYTLVGSGSNGTKQLTLIVAATSGDVITIVRDAGVDRDTEFLNNGDLTIGSMNLELDKIITLIQQVEMNQEQRSWMFRRSALSAGISLTIPKPEAGKRLAWSPTAKALVNVSDSFTVTNTDTSAVETIAALKLVTGTVNNELIIVGGYYAVGEGGGGLFYWDSASVETDNGGTIIKATATATGRWLRIYTGAINVEDFGADSSAADNSAVIQTATAFAKSNNASLFWPDKDYTALSSIDDLHTVEHLGNGSITRGSDTFYLTPEEGQSNTVYVNAASGSATNDGLTSSQPVNSFQISFDILENYARAYLQGSWTIQASAETITLTSAETFTAKSVNWVTIKGPDVSGHPNVPTCVIDGTGGSAYDHGIRIRNGAKVWVQDIKFQNFTSSNSRIGLAFEPRSDGYAKNVHAYNCDWAGIYAADTLFLLVEGGILDACRLGVIAIATGATIGYGATSTAESTVVSNCTEAGISFIAEAHGHADYCLIEDNAIGLYASRGVNVHEVSCDFKRNTRAIKTRSGGVVADDGNEYNIGTADANDNIFDFGAYSGASNELFELTGGGDTVEPRSTLLVARDLGDHPHTGDTVRTVVATPYTIKAGYFTDDTGAVSVIGPKLTFKITGSRANGGSPGLCEIGLQFGGNDITQWAMVTTDADEWELDVEIWAQAEASQLIMGTLTQGTADAGGRRRVGKFSRSIDMSVDRDIQIDLQMANAGDTLTVETVEIWRTG